MPRSLLTAFWILIGLTYLIGAIFIDVIDVDAAQYASIACEMLESGNWLIVHHKYADYLDKPPLLFWLSGLSYKLFGIKHFAYRLPSIIATILGLFAVHGIAKKLYDNKTAELASLITASTQAWILFNHDIRTDTLLAAFSITAIWQLLLYSDSKKPINFIFGFIAIGLAMMAKGPIGAAIPVFALSAFWIGRNDWKILIKPLWLLGILITVLVISPMIIGLWQQWEWDGLYFYFWKQSFGRITGENSWRNDSGPLFFTHTFLWSFLPWSIIAIYAYSKRLYRFWDKGADQELLTLFGFLIPFIALSFSKYKLPHYIFPLYPFMAIITANELQNFIQNNKLHFKVLFGIQSFLNVLLISLTLLICIWIFPTSSIAVWTIIILGIAANIYLLINRSFSGYRLFSPALSAFLMLNMILNLHFYPELLKYQSGSMAADFINKNHLIKDEIAVYRLYPNSLDFYIKTIPQIYEAPGKLVNAISEHPMWVYTDETGKKQLEVYGAVIENSIEFNHFHISNLSIPILERL